ncbi:cyclic nucleotide-binding domain-containing protein [Azonexus sp.]|uniref:cyclic nucleotide-binding domain-containing protein n=1 Tax=Azonexus sp. TaxID=1872668 RepID=UPI0027BA17E4|nr:cyclic nucleotide-binding domain-containing protein [Azonexus sp.]
MRKVLYIFGLLTDSDIEWLARIGSPRSLTDGTVLIREGEKIDRMFILIDGHMDVSVAGLGIVANLGSGEILGEMSFVDSSPTSATVTARGEVKLLELPKRALEAHFAEDPGFGMRFFRALTVFLADRMRSTIKRMGYGKVGDLNADEMMEDELDESLLDTVSIAGDRFSRMMKVLSGSSGHGERP